jgi:outer membrane protein assembly factor BamB
MNRFLSAFVVCLVFFSVAPSRAADWPTYLNGGERVGATTETLAAPLKLQWVYSSPAPPELAFSGPRSEPIEGHVMLHRMMFDNVLNVAAAGGRLVFGSSVDNKVYCCDAQTGQTHWTFFTDGPIRLAPTIWQEKVLVGSDDGYVYCLNAADGSLVWKLHAGPADERLLGRGRMISRWPVRTGVLVYDGIAYFGAGVFPHETVYLCAADAATGKIIWRNDRISQEDAGRNPLSPQGYLLCNDELLIVPSGRSLPAAFDRKTGDELYQKTHSWRGAAGGVVGGVKAVLADGQIYAQGDNHFLAMDQKTGNVGFAFIWGRQLTMSGNRAFFADGKNITAVGRIEHARATVERQKLVTQQSDLRRNRSTMKPDEFQKRDAELSQQIAGFSVAGASWQAPSNLQSALIVAGDLVIAGGQNQVAAFDAATGKQVWNAAVEGDAGGLAAAGGHLFVSTSQGKIYAFADTKSAPAGTSVVNYPGKLADSPYANDELSPMYAAAAEQIIKETGVTRGYCLVLGSENGRLAYELAKRTELRIYGVERDAAKAAASRRALDSAGLHGTRITIVHSNPSKKMPLPNFFANLVVSDTLLLTGQVPGDPLEWSRCVKPCGGIAYFGAPPSAPAVAIGLSGQKLEETLTATGLASQANLKTSATQASLVREKLPGAGSWSHQYGDVANTSVSQDFRVQGGMGVLWYGDPGPAPMINRHEAAAAPLSTNGRMFIQGVDNIMCYDAYNGLFLWEQKNPGAIRTGVFNNEETSNLVASDDALFMAVDDTCTVYDAATGKVLAQYKTPASEDKIPRVWGYLGHYNGLLIGTSTIRKELAASLRRRGHTVDNATDSVFAIDVKTGRRAWTYRGKSIMHMTIAVGDERVFFIDSSITSEQREALLREDKTALKDLPPEEAKKKEEELKKLDVRLAVALDARTGRKLWENPVDVTDCSYVGIGGGQLTLIYNGGHVLICGANANGHYWRQFLTGQFSQRRLVVLDSETGEKLWGKDANYRHRPIIIGEEIFAEPWAFNLHTGVEKTRENPLTGEETKWQFSRPGHHCGPLTATPNTLFFRSGFTGYYDLYSDSGTSHFAGHRTGCWVNVLPGNGLVMIPEASAGCVCQFSIAATVVLEPRDDRDTWKIYSATGSQTPVKHLAVNLGAPGDRRDQFGTLWLAYPRPALVGRLEYELDIKPQLAKGGGYYAENSESVKVQNADNPWIFTSGARGLTRCELPLLGEGDDPAAYTVKLYFADLDNTPAGQRLFDVKLQGKPVATGVDVTEKSEGSRRALVLKFDSVPVKQNLQVELIPHGAALPTLSAIEVLRE